MSTKDELMKLADAYVQAVIRDRIMRQEHLGSPARQALEDALVEACDTGITPEQDTAGKLIDAWVESHGKRIPWETAVGITAIVTKMPDEEKSRLLAFGV